MASMSWIATLVTYESTGVPTTFGSIIITSTPTSTVLTSTNTSTSSETSTFIKFSTTAPTSISPDTLTSNIMPSTVLPQSGISSGIPTSLPGSIANPDNGGQRPEQALGTTHCAIAFTSELRYDFVYGNPAAINEIVQGIPRVIAYALDLPNLNNITMDILEPQYTNGSNYITTLALFYILDSWVEPLRAQVTQANSRFHTKSSDTNLNQFIELIETNYPITDVPATESASGPTAGGTTTFTSSTPANTLLTSGVPAPTSNNTQVGSIVGGVLGATVLLALIIFFILRYRRAKARQKYPYSGEAKLLRMLEKDGNPRTELGGKIQPAEKDGIARNELYSDMPIWELPAGGSSDHDSDIDIIRTSSNRQA